MSVDVRPVVTRADRKAFVRLPWRIYPSNYPAWVPPLIAEEHKRIDPERNPFFLHGAAALFIAYSGGNPVGRIAAIENRQHNEFHDDRVGFFGFFESTDDPLVAGALLDEAAAWVRERGLTSLRGPTSFSTNEECGLLVENFGDPPCVMMTYNPPYYPTFLEGWGLAKVKDLLAYEVTYAELDKERLARMGRLLEKSGLDSRIRSLDMKRFDQEVELVRDLYNAAWERNWGFVPMTDAEVDHMAKQLKPVVDRDLVLFAEVEGEPVGFALALPDVNQALRHINGRLLPFGLLKLLWHMRRINGIRVLTLGLKPEFRRTGLAGQLYIELFKRGTAKGHTRAESSWILEDNHLMRTAVEKLGCRRYKTYRLYERDLAP